MAIFYGVGMFDEQRQTLGNWFMGAELTIPATSSDSVVILFSQLYDLGIV
jgi:hypothetical protein